MASEVFVDKITGKTAAATVEMPAGFIKNVHIATGRYNLADGDQSFATDTEVRVSNVLTVSVTNGYKYFFIFNVPTVQVGGSQNSQNNKSQRYYIRKTATASPSDGTGIASETLIHSTGVNTLYINANYNGPILTGAVCGIYTATATETNYFCGSTMTGESGTESGNIKATDSNAMLICQEIFQ